MNKILPLIAALSLMVGCAPDPGPSPDDYGYHYTDVTPMGIMYRIDEGGVDLDPSRLDYYFSATMNCTGYTFDRENMVVVSTQEDANPEREGGPEGWAWQPTKTKPALIVINSVIAPGMRYQLLTHEFVHILVKKDSHNHEAFERCAWQAY